MNEPNEKPERTNEPEQKEPKMEAVQIAVRLTKTQKKLYDLLLDGKWHSLVQLHGCVWDDQTSNKTVAAYLSVLRDKIRPHGLHIVRDTKDESGVKVSYYCMRHID